MYNYRTDYTLLLKLKSFPGGFNSFINLNEKIGTAVLSYMTNHLLIVFLNYVTYSNFLLFYNKSGNCIFIYSNIILNRHERNSNFIENGQIKNIFIEKGNTFKLLIS